MAAANELPKRTAEDFHFPFRKFVSVDSAPMHIAAAVGTPLVAIFGPTDPGRHKPPAQKITVIKKDLKCSPCYKPDCKTLICIKGIDINEVAQAVAGFL